MHEERCSDSNDKKLRYFVYNTNRNLFFCGALFSDLFLQNKYLVANAAERDERKKIINRYITEELNILKKASRVVGVFESNQNQAQMIPSRNI